MTVAAVDEDSIECLWLGDEGELFRETIPSVVLTAAPAEDDDLDDEESDHEDADEDEDEDEDATADKKHGSA
jgi:hypothetical protein